MRCDLCKKAKATVHITQDPMPGPVVTIHLCPRCAKKHGVDDPTGFSLADLHLPSETKQKAYLNLGIPLHHR